MLMVAFVLAFGFACSCGTLRLKAPGETELTMARTITDNLRSRKQALAERLHK